MANNNLQRHESRDKSKWIVTFIAILLAFVAIAAAFVCIFSDGFTNWDRFKPEEEQPEETVSTGGTIIGESVGSGVQLMTAWIAPTDFVEYGISTMAETAYTLTATISPDSAPNKTVDWSVEFVNPSSSWANGKTVTDYVTVTPTSDGALTATVECLQAFGEQIKVVVTSRDNENATASCTVDYEQRLIAYVLKFENSFGQTFTIDTRNIVDGKVTASADWGGVLTLSDIESVFSDFTVSPLSEATSIRISGTDEMAEQIDDSESFTYGEVTYQNYDIGSNFALDYHCITFGDEDYTLYDFSKENSADDAITAVRSRCDRAPFCKVTINNKYSFLIYCVADMFGTPVSSITLDDTSLVF